MNSKNIPLELNVIDEIDVEKKKVFVRIDLDCGNIDNRDVLDIKIQNCLPTLKYLLEKQAKVVIGTHIGSPSGGNNEKYSLESIGINLSEHLEKEVFFVDSIFNDSFKKLLIDLPFGSLILLDNLAFLKKETENNSELAQFLATKIDLYVNEAFSLGDSSYASLNSILDFVEREKVSIGFNFNNEYQQLKRIKNGLQRPAILFLNGKNVEKKIEFAGNFIDEVDAVFLLGEIANTHSKVMSSTFSGEYEKEAYYTLKNFISSAKTRNIKIFKINLNSRGTRFDMPLNDVEYIVKTVSDAATILWLGSVEGIDDLQKAFDSCSGFKCAFGNEASISLSSNSYNRHFDFISTSDQAAIDFLMGNPLKVLEKLTNI